MCPMSSSSCATNSEIRAAVGNSASECNSSISVPTLLRRPKQVHLSTAVFFLKKYREMLWVVSVIYPVFLALTFHESFSFAKVLF